MRLLAITPLLFALLLQGCASTQFDVTGKRMARPICSTGSPNVTAAVYWATHWRENQKEPAAREEIARRGITSAMTSATCLTVSGIRQVAAEQAAMPATELVGLMQPPGGHPDLVVTIEVRELGPILEIGIPVLIKGGTDVQMDVRVTDVATNQVLAKGRSHWRNGGPFVIKGIKTLEADIASALLLSLGLEKAPVK